ncbi:MAG: hypothetical protein HY682_03125 [Chloroflexi bacterium]|nr:hypothetical protein [Chloroflexota bacterium]
MAKSYVSPLLLSYGSVESLTASFVKCTPVPDHSGWGHTHATDEDGNKVDQAGDMHSNCLPPNQLTPG